MNTTNLDPTRVVIVGGGVAALEAMLALREMGGSRVAVDMFAPRKDFVLKPLGVSEAFGHGEALTYDLDEIAANAGANFHLRSVQSVDRERRRVHLREGIEFSYDYLIVATGTKALWVVPGAKTFWGLHGQEMISELLDSLRASSHDRVLLTMPEPAVWPLPIYELALFLAADAAERPGDGPMISIVTPERAPLETFGSQVSRQVTDLLHAESIQLITRTAPIEFADGFLQTSEGPLEADAVITLPRLTGRRIDGVPFDEMGFVPVDGHGLIEGCEREYAAGDVISYPLKFGGAATAQADVVAAAIGAEAWEGTAPEPFEPDLKATLLTPQGPVPLGEEPSVSDDTETNDWNPALKVSGRFLTPVLETEKSRTTS